MSKPFPSYFCNAALVVLAVLLLQFAAPSAWATTVTIITSGTWTCPAVSLLFQWPFKAVVVLVVRLRLPPASAVAVAVAVLVPTVLQ